MALGLPASVTCQARQMEESDSPGQLMVFEDRRGLRFRQGFSAGGTASPMDSAGIYNENGRGGPINTRYRMSKDLVRPWPPAGELWRILSVLDVAQGGPRRCNA